MTLIINSCQIREKLTVIIETLRLIFLRIIVFELRTNNKPQVGFINGNLKMG